jgi:PEP-CTERM motif
MRIQRRSGVVVLVLAAVAMMLGGGGQAKAGIVGSIFLTGHDPDFHAFEGGNQTGAQHINQDAIAFVTDPAFNTFAASGNNRFLLVMDATNPGAGYSDPRLGLNISGFTGKYDVADNGAAGGSILNLNTVNFSNYNAIVIASDFGGWLKQSEVNILDARSSDIIKYLNAGGGLYAMAESGPPDGLASTGLFGFLPFVVSTDTKNQTEVGNVVTAFGAGLGLKASDINGNESHNIFTATSGLNVVDFDSSGEILSLAGRGVVGSGGVNPSPPAIPEPTTFTLFGIGVVSLIGHAWRRRKQVA